MKYVFYFLVLFLRFGTDAVMCAEVGGNAFKISSDIKCEWDSLGSKCTITVLGNQRDKGQKSFEDKLAVELSVREDTNNRARKFKRQFSGMFLNRIQHPPRIAPKIIGNAEWVFISIVITGDGLDPSRIHILLCSNEGLFEIRGSSSLKMNHESKIHFRKELKSAEAGLFVADVALERHLTDDLKRDLYEEWNAVAKLCRSLDASE